MLKDLRVVFISFHQCLRVLRGVIITDRIALVCDKSFKFLPYQLDGSVLDYHGFHG